MAAFQIYLPHSSTLESVGLTDGFDGAQEIPSAGPDGQRGTICSWITPQAVRFGYKPDQQTWVPSFVDGDRQKGAYWVGFWNDSPPAESDLRRHDVRRGAMIPLNNKERWVITTPDHLDRFPRVNDDGSLRWVTDQQFNWLTTDLDRRKETLDLSEDRVSIMFDPSKDWAFLCRLIAVNYRITPEVIVHLDLFSEMAVKQTVAALMGLKLVGDE